MTKERYFEMCELMGDEPDPEHIPVEFSDFPEEIQTAFQIYGILQDTWEGMSGTYTGKNLSGIRDILEIYGIDPTERKLTLEFVHLIDRERMGLIEQKRKQEESLKTQKAPT